MMLIASAFAAQVFFSGHYAGNDYSISLRNGEAWKKVFGPVFIYLNSDQGTDPKSLWENAKQQVINLTGYNLCLS